MKAIDLIDSLLQLYDDPLPKQNARAALEEDIIVLNDHLRSLIDTHSSIVVDRDQARIIIKCMSLRSQINQYFTLVKPQTGEGDNHG